MEDEKYFEDYFKDIKKNYKIGTEYTPRTPLENMLNAIKKDNVIRVIQERKKEKGDKGKPDFKIERNGLLVGYIETKPIGTNLDEIVDKNSTSRETKQLYAYLTVSPNLILTNYTDFILFKDGKHVRTEAPFKIKDKNVESSRIRKALELFNLFFLFRPQAIKSPEKLSILLAERTKIFKDFINEVISGNTSSPFRERLISTDGLYALLKETLIDDLSLDEFADAYAQTITYGLFLARLNSDGQIDEKTALNFIPKSVGALRELFKTIEIEEIPQNIGWIIEAIIEILNSIDKKQFSEILSFKKTYDYEDPYVYFYEKFLAEYDKEKRKAKGVYYTPIPVVWFIVKSINSLLKEDFKADGLKDNEVTVLDFATGTGTFLLEAFKIAIDETDKGSRTRLIKEHLLKNFYGFEYLIAPYTVAHLKLSQFMQDNNYDLEDTERINVYLTDTLDNDAHKRYVLFPKISEEGSEANEIKLKKPILVVTGNPPYSNYSRNNKKWIKDLIGTYKEGLEEKKINLDDDYIKFLRLAHWKIEQSGKGIIGVITNNSFLEGLSHKVMRQKLFDTFDRIYILNLHGNGRRGETDKNVFDVQVGVTISIFVKLQKQAVKKEVYYYSIVEDADATTREKKYDFLLNNDVSSLKWKAIYPEAPNYWFIKKDLAAEKEYGKGISLTDIFSIFGSAIKTDRDELFIDADKDRLIERIKVLLTNNYSQEFIERYNVKDSSSYKLTDRVKSQPFSSTCINKIRYRPFNDKWIYYDKNIISRPDFEVMQHLLNEKNLGLVFSKIWDLAREWTAVMVVDGLVDMQYIVPHGSTYVAPLYLNKESRLIHSKQKRFGEKVIDKGIYSETNFTDDFITFISNKYKRRPTPEQILSYIYAIFNSATYREKYHEFLLTDYPKVRFIDSWSAFEKLAVLGWKLIELHTLKNIRNETKVAAFKEKGNDYVEKITYDDKTQRVYINDNQYFDNVSENVWNFEIGGYLVLYKWLNERKGRILSYEEQNKFKKISYVLHETLGIRGQIDKVYTEK